MMWGGIFDYCWDGFRYWDRIIEETKERTPWPPKIRFKGQYKEPGPQTWTVIENKNKLQIKLSKGYTRLRLYK